MRNKKFIEITNKITYKLQELERMENVPNKTKSDLNEIESLKKNIAELRSEQKATKEMAESIKKKKAWLNRAYSLEKLIEIDLEEIEKLKLLIDTGYGIDYSKPNVQTSKNGEAFFTAKADKLVDVKTEYIKRVNAQVEIKNEIRAKIDTLETNREKLVLIMRHIQFLNWNKIAINMSESKRSCYRIYDQAIKKIDI